MKKTVEYIKKIQKALKDAGFQPGPIDGIMGRKTAKAITDFQRSNGLIADGVVGPITSKALFGANHKKPTSKQTIPPQLTWLLEAWHMNGLKEVTGKNHNSTILNWAKNLKIPSYTNDEIPWCGLFVGHCIGSTLPDDPMPGNILGAQQWLKFGNKCEPQFGSILVFWRGKPSSWKGHVGFYWGEDATCYHVLGGNQSNKVCVSRIAKRRLKGARWPGSQPEMGIERFASKEGILQTTNEA